MVIASLFFYGWWNPKFVALVLASISFNYIAGYFICKGKSVTEPWASPKVMLAVAVITNLLLLFYFKYTNFFIASVNSSIGLSWSNVEILLPLGISFFTFTQIAFLVDAYKGIAREYNFSHYLLFVTYFPHLIAGPVLHHKQMMPQFQRDETFRLSSKLATLGMALFCIGLAKKVLLADTFSAYVSPIFQFASEGNQPQFVDAWTATLAYTLQLYFDFSGYSDMAVGLSLMFGVRLPVNFSSPYQAHNIIEFWRRWHITLSHFLRDYLYIPLGGNRFGKIRRYVNLLITMILGGLWHGANWTFVIWGALHGLYLVVNHAWHALRRFAGFPLTKQPTFIGRVAGAALTFTCAVVAWVFFRADSVSAAWLILKAMSQWSTRYPIQRGAVPALGCGLFIVFFLPNSQKILSYFEKNMQRFMGGLYAFGLSVLFLLCILNISGKSDFLYFDF